MIIYIKKTGIFSFVSKVGIIMRRRDTVLKMSILAALLFLNGTAPAHAADVSNKQQTISSGTYENAYGGYTITEGESALQNTLALSGSAIVQNVAAGGWSRYSNANGNTITIALNSDGYIGTGTSNAVYGGVAEQESNGTAMHMIFFPSNQISPCFTV